MAKTKADQIRELSKKWLETGDNSILNKLIHAAHDGVHFQVPNWRILERYKELSLELHAHFFRLGDVRGIDEDLCAISQYLSTSNMSNTAAIGGDKRDAFFASPNGRKCKRSVLIDVIELIQDPEGMKLGVRVPSVVRLRSLDDCLRLNGYATETIFLEAPFESVIGQADRELVGHGRGFIVGKNQLPDNMIKSGSEVIQTLSDLDAKREIGSGKTECEVKTSVHVSVALGDNAAFFQTSGNIRPYRCQMFLCPDEFLPNTVKRMIHEENSKDPEGS